MRRRVRTDPEFYESLFNLDTSEATVHAGSLLLLRATLHPESAPAMPGMGIRVIKTRSYEGFPALRLFYWIDDEDIFLLEIERYVEGYDDD